MIEIMIGLVVVVSIAGLIVAVSYIPHFWEVVAVLLAIIAIGSFCWVVGFEVLNNLPEIKELTNR